MDDSLPLWSILSRCMSSQGLLIWSKKRAIITFFTGNDDQRLDLVCPSSVAAAFFVCSNYQDRALTMWPSSGEAGSNVNWCDFECLDDRCCFCCSSQLARGLVLTCISSCCVLLDWRAELEEGGVRRWLTGPFELVVGVYLLLQSSSSWERWKGSWCWWSYLQAIQDHIARLSKHEGVPSLIALRQSVSEVLYWLCPYVMDNSCTTHTWKVKMNEH